MTDLIKLLGEEIGRYGVQCSETKELALFSCDEGQAERVLIDCKLPRNMADSSLLGDHV